MNVKRKKCGTFKKPNKIHKYNEKENKKREKGTPSSIQVEVEQRRLTTKCKQLTAECP